jgi:hypothetical protein
VGAGTVAPWALRAGRRRDAHAASTHRQPGLTMPSARRRSGGWRAHEAAHHGGAFRPRPPRAAWAGPVSPVRPAGGDPRAASRAWVARMTPRGWSIRAGRIAPEAARAPALVSTTRTGGASWLGRPRGPAPRGLWTVTVDRPVAGQPCPHGDRA